MIIVAVVCLLLAAAIVAFMLVTATTAAVVFPFFAGDVHIRPIWIFVAGVVTLLLAQVGIDSFRRGTTKKVAQRRELRRLRKGEQSPAGSARSSTTADDATREPRA